MKSTLLKKENERTEEEDQPSALISPGLTHRSVAKRITRIPLAPRTPRGWILLFALALALSAVLTASLCWLLMKGTGIWGINQPVAWGLAIVNFVWWIGIAHAGTLISAILLLFRQRWRASIGRIAEAMTIFAVVCAGIFPLLHMGRPWLFYWLLPYPNTMRMWPQFRSPLMWDVFAVGTYATISAIFWYMGMIPDLGAMRDRARTKAGQYGYGIAALGWRGSARQWMSHESAMVLLAGMATPLVLSVHTVISFDFAVSLLPGWHSTIFPPYFVAGAIYSGLAMVLTLVIPLRRFYRLNEFINPRHIDNLGKAMLAAGLIVAYGYAMEAFMAWYSASHWEAFMLWNRLFGPMGWAYWTLLVCNLVLPLSTLWWRRVRASLPCMFVLSLIVNIGMWMERFVIVVTSQQRDFLPSSWGVYQPTRWEFATYAGTMGLFFLLFLLFLRFLPMIPIHEMRRLLAVEKREAGALAEVGD
jgi:molybdopterin-containing oxidoreductase family membrane subunit